MDHPSRLAPDVRAPSSRGARLSDSTETNRSRRVLAISGSLRARSSNTALVQAARLVAPANTVVTVYEQLAELPPFNPDLDTDGAVPPPSVAEWRAGLREADAVLISSPEYAHGVPGVLKNALDWVVGTGEFMNKPVALVNTSTRSNFVSMQLVETLTVMMGRVVIAIALPVDGRPLDARAIADDDVLSATLNEVLSRLVSAVEA